MSFKRKIAQYFRRSTGVHLNPLVSGAMRCGAIVDIDKDGDVDFLGSLASLGVELPAVRASTALFPTFGEFGERTLGDKLKNSLQDALPMSDELVNALLGAPTVSVSFSERVEVHYIDVVELSLNIARRLEVLGREDKATMQQLRRFLRADAGNRVVGAVYLGTISIEAHFSLAIEKRFDTNFEGPVSVGGERGFGWERRSDTTLVTNRSVPFAFDAWKWSRGRLRDAD